jgi:hypothetical protein
MPSEQHPSVVPAEDQHPFKPDGSGTTCEVCELPEFNRHHQESA